MEKEKRRERGSGTIAQLKDGRFRARLQYISTSDGKIHDKSKICDTEKEAARILRVWRKEMMQETYVDVKKESVEKFMTDWLVNVKKQDLKPTSYDRLELTINKHIVPYLGNMQMGSITSDMIQQHLNNLIKDGKGYSTVKKVYDAFNSCFKWGIAGRKIQFNPMDAVSVPGTAKIRRKGKSKIVKTNPVKFFTEEQQDKLIEAALTKFPNGTMVYRFGYAIPFLLNTGLRLSELLALRWDRDVNFDDRCITVNNSIVLVKSRESSDKKTELLEQDSVKSDAGERILYLNDEALDALNHLYKLTGKHRYVISTKHGKPVQPSNIERMMRTVLIRAGLPTGRGYSPHALRHTFATNLFRQGVETKTISELLGHSDVSVTLNIYTHVIEDQKKDALVKISDRKQKQEEIEPTE